MQRAIVLISLCFFLALLLIPIPLAGAQSQPPDKQRDAFDTQLAAILPKIIAFQEDYLKAKGRYFQALASSANVPTDSALTLPDLTRKSTDQIEGLDLLWPSAQLPSKLPFVFRIDVYDGPAGRGYIVIVQSQLLSQLWQRALNNGPETWREQDWIEIKPVTLP